MKRKRKASRKEGGGKSFLVDPRTINILIFSVVFLFLSTIYYREYMEEMGMPALVPHIVIWGYMLTGGIMHLVCGFYPMSAIFFVAVILYHLGSTNNEEGWNLLWDAFVTLQIHSIIDFIFLDRKEFNRPLYLALSKRSVTELCASYFSSLYQVKHWMIICETAIDNSFYIFHARGAVFRSLKPTFEISSRQDVSRTCYGFHKLGLTNVKILKSFLKKQYQFCLTCQQYCDSTACYLCYPQGYACLLTKVIGRVEFYFMIIILTIVSLVNYLFLGWDIPVGLVFIAFYAKDFWMEEYARVRGVDWTTVRQVLTVILILIFLWYTQVLDYFGMLRIYVFLLLNGVLMLLVWYIVPDIKIGEESPSEKKRT